MPRKRTQAKGRRAGITPVMWAALHDAPLPEERSPWDQFTIDDPDNCRLHGRLTLREAWGAHRDEILPEWIAAHPGTRPSCWWTYDSPDAGADKPGFRGYCLYGIEGPRPWRDPSHPPRFDTQAEYLEHHKLLTDEERQVLDLETAARTRISVEKPDTTDKDDPWAKLASL